MIVKLTNKAFQESGLSKTQFAKELGISKSFVLRVLNGDKPLSQNMLDGILAIETITSETKAALKEEFERISFGEKNYEDVQYLIKLINGFEESINRRDSVYVRDEILKKVLFGNQFNFCINSESEFYEIISFFSKRSLENSGSLFYSNYSIEQSTLSSLLFTIFYERDFDKKIDFCHIVNVNSDDIKSLLETIFESLKWSELCFNTFVKSAESYAIGTMFPYYIITDEVVILFNKECNKATLFNDKSTVDFYIDYFQKIRSEYNPILSFNLDELDCFNMDVLSKHNLRCSIDGALCIAQFVDYETAKEIAVPSLKNKNFLINAVVHYFQSSFNKKPIQFLSKKSLKKFADDGDLRVISEKYVQALSLEQRKKIFENLKEKNDNIFVMDESKLSPYHEMDIHIFDKQLSISLYPTNQESPYYAVFLDFPFKKSSNLETVCKNMMKFLRTSDCFLGNEYLNDVIEEMILLCSCNEEKVN